jgi:hypothetical protein
MKISTESKSDNSVINAFCEKFFESLKNAINEGRINREEFYDYGKMSKSFNHSKILKIICQTLEKIGYDWLTDARINRTTCQKRLQSQVRYVADVVGYRRNELPENFSVIIEYESIDSGRNKNGRLKIIDYISRMFEVKNIEFYVMIAVFTTTITEKTRNKEKDQWGMPRDRKIMYEEVISEINNEIKKLSEGSKFALISIFDEKIEIQIFDKSGEKVKNNIPIIIRHASHK